MHACMLRYFSHVQLFVTLWTLAHQATLSMGFSRQEYWSGLPIPSPNRTVLATYIFYIPSNSRLHTI